MWKLIKLVKIKCHPLQENAEQEKTESACDPLFSPL